MPDTRAAILVATMLAVFPICARAGNIDHIVDAGCYPWCGNGAFHDGPSKCVKWHLVSCQNRNGGSFDYIQEPGRSCATRIEGAAIPAEGPVVSLVGRLHKPPGSECWRILDAITASGISVARPLEANGVVLCSGNVWGLCTKSRGVVAPGSVGGH